MAHISTFLQVSIDGYFAGPAGEIDWFKNSPDPEFEAFSLERASGDSVVSVFRGRNTRWRASWRHGDRDQSRDLCRRRIIWSR